MSNTQIRLQTIQKATRLFLLVIGILLLLFALLADWLGFDVTPGFGILQMVSLLFGISCLTLTLFLWMKANRLANAAKSLQADIGWRLAATGLLFVYVTGLADLIGIGTHVGPDFIRPFFGPLQLAGFALGGVTILIGAFLYHTSRGSRDSSSLEFLLKE
jgi:hypothetical protein